MSQLRSCYFCGTVGDSLREYELLPDGLASSERSPSAVLCSTCHEKLRRVLEPARETATNDRTGSSDVASASTPSITFGSDGTASDTVPNADDDDRSERETPGGDDAEIGAVARGDAETPAGTAPSDGSDDDGTSDDGSGDGETNDDETDGDGPADHGSGDDETTNGEADDDPKTATDDDLPDGYYKVLRLLQNREFPMERGDLTALVTGAYDVSEPQCERILARAIERGVLVEDGATLDLGRN